MPEPNGRSRSRKEGREGGRKEGRHAGRKEWKEEKNMELMKGAEGITGVDGRKKRRGGRKRERRDKRKDTIERREGWHLTIRPPASCRRGRKASVTSFVPKKLVFIVASAPPSLRHTSAVRARSVRNTRTSRN
jgi:hypothetical protein